jgi:hypothetical protein
VLGAVRPAPRLVGRMTPAAASECIHFRLLMPDDARIQGGGSICKHGDGGETKLLRAEEIGDKMWRKKGKGRRVCYVMDGNGG